MKRILIYSVLLIIFIILPQKNANAGSHHVLSLSPANTNLMLVGDTAIIKTPTLNKNINQVKYKIKGNAISLLKQSDNNTKNGYQFTFKAVKSGNALLLEKTSKLKDKKESTEIKKFHVRVVSIEEIPKASIASIARNPLKFTKNFVLITGTCRGWGSPKKAKDVWGNMVTRSDQIIEDETGAMYVSGVKVENGKSVKLVCKVMMNDRGNWAVFGHRILPVTIEEGKVLKTIVSNNNAFAFDLATKLFQTSGNVFFSPISISYALAMTYAGARTNTEKQMAKVLHFTMSQNDLHPALSNLIDKMVEGDNKPYSLCFANALWGQKDYPFLPNFIKTINRYYGEAFFTVDFVEHKDDAVKKINHWIEKQTKNKIKELIANSDIDNLTRLVLTDAIYFKGKWLSPFKKEDTQIRPFHISPTKTVETPMMYQEETFPFYDNGNIQVVELPYSGQTLSMIIILPKELDGLSSFENNFTIQHFNSLLASMHNQKVMIYMPRFKIKSKYYLKSILSEMGMQEAFSNRADFSGIDGTKNLKISKVIHQSYVDVNEEGTEAAAATAVVMQLKSIALSPVFMADHPFIFMIIHKDTKSILFIGKVVNPIITK